MNISTDTNLETRRGNKKQDYINRYINGPLRTIIITENEFKRAFHENIRDNLSEEQLRKVDSRIKIYFIRAMINEINFLGNDKNGIIHTYNKYRLLFYNRFGTNILDSLSDEDKEEIGDSLKTIETVKDKSFPKSKKEPEKGKNNQLSSRYKELTGKDLSVMMFGRTMATLDDIYRASEVVYTAGNIDESINYFASTEVPKKTSTDYTDEEFKEIVEETLRRR